METGQQRPLVLFLKIYSERLKGISLVVTLAHLLKTLEESKSFPYGCGRAGAVVPRFAYSQHGPGELPTFCDIAVVPQGT